jgi:3-deoxy-manno-octulosonate cytidylyltransferase (CMP-KDO synthetase)
MIIHGIIPARWASTRFPGKPLALINGKTMIRRVYDQAAHAQSLSKVVVATDDRRIFDHVAAFGGEVMMTSSKHQSGTSRCAEIIERSGAADPDVVINIQGDEPFIDPQQIDKLAALFSNTGIQIATLIKKIASAEELLNPNVVKVVTASDGKALYFSRAAIPFVRGYTEGEFLDTAAFYKHIGIYAYRTEVLKHIIKLPAGALETAESLEQLRWLEHGLTIHTALTHLESFAVDTPEDLSKFINS